jgi:DNA polymerase-3 subunit epsilon
MGMSDAILKDMDVLVLDCQATQNNPDRGFLLELGWSTIKASDDIDTESLSGRVETHLIRIPDGRTIPHAVRRVTGLSDADFLSAIDEEKVWFGLSEAAIRVAKSNHSNLCPTVIHYARYEAPLLHKLHASYGEGGRNRDHFPFDITCTHEIINNLLPHLPRKSLRAIAGYFGFSVPENRRCLHHVMATAAIWRHALNILEEDYGIKTYDEMRQWLDRIRRSPKTGRSRKQYPLNPELRLGLPDVPGVYRMLRSNGDAVYVGKAKSLKHRVNSYFQKRRHDQEHLPEMLTQVSRVDVSVTNTALEAALLESDEIKRLSPAYNRALRAKGRAPVFYSKNFERYAHSPSYHFSTGPLPNRDALKPVYLLGQALRQEQQVQPDPETAAASLGIPALYAPEPDLYIAGLQSFRQKYARVLDRCASLWESAVPVLGRMLWLERLEDESKDDATEEKEGHEDNGAAHDRVWTSDTVLHAVENVISRSAHLIRRSRWLCILSESTLAWDRNGSEQDEKNVMVFNGGNVILCKTQSPEEEIPVPPGYGQTVMLRKSSFDLMTYDRMRVLMSEIKRIITEGRDIHLRLRPNVTLQRGSLAEILLWL